MIYFLDALGAVGIARCFAYGSAHNIKTFDENELKNIKLDYAEESEKVKPASHIFITNCLILVHL